MRWLVMSLSLLSVVARADEGWVQIHTRNGVVYEKRAVSGSKWLEYRATTQVPLAPVDALRVLWSGVTENLPPSIKKRQVLKRTDDELVVYDQINTPVISDRDVTIRIHKVARPDGVEVRFESSEALGPPPSSKFVRIPVVRGAWTIVAAPGGSRLVYTCYSEPGGSIPAFLVRGAQQDQISLDVERILSRVRGH